MALVGDTVGTALSGIGSGFFGGAMTAVKLLPYLVVGLVLGGFLYLLFEDIYLYKYKVRLKKVVGNSFQWYEDKAMIKRLKNGAKIWHLKKLKIDVGLPPDKILIPSTSGKIVAIGKLLNDNNIIWEYDTFTVDTLNDSLKRVLKKKATLDYKRMNKQAINPEEQLTEEELNLLIFNANYQPVSTNDRMALAHGMEEANFGKKDFNELIAKALPYVFMVTLFALLLFGFKYYAGPMAEYGNGLLASSKSIVDEQKAMAEILYAIKNDQQLIQADLTFLKDKENSKGNTTR